MKRQILLISIFIFLGLFFSFLLLSPKTISLELPNGQIIKAEIAKTPTEQAKGLMFRENLKENTGMFFIFEKEELLSFWMKNTLIPLDIIFLDENLKIINIAKAEPCQKDPCPLYKSKSPARYVLEINQSLDTKYQGQSIKITPR